MPEENYEENLQAMLAAFKAVLDGLDEDFLETLQSDVKKYGNPEHNIQSIHSVENCF